MADNIDHIETLVCEDDEYITDLAESYLCGLDTGNASYTWINDKYIPLMEALNNIKRNTTIYCVAIVI